MARFSFSIPTINSLSFGSLLIVLASAGGCQSRNSGAIANLPQPNFNGPIVAAPVPAPIARSAPAQQPSPIVKQAPRGSLASEREWVPTTAPRSWRWIVIHHSATPAGSASVFDRMHREKGWDELGYHFVIGNGTDSSNGEVEVGPRWPKQKWGAHAKTPDNRFNDYGIGICLVGNFDIERPTPQQLKSLASLTAWLMKTYRVPAGNVIGHRDTKATECPGRNLSIAQVRRLATQTLAAAGEHVPEDAARTADATISEWTAEPIDATSATPVLASPE
jgi:hypothetical protein